MIAEGRLSGILGGVPDPLLLSDLWVVSEGMRSGSQVVRFSGGVPDPLLLPDP